MANWIGEPSEKRNGCLLVMNIGNENCEQLPEKYVNTISERVGQAHADGWMVLYVFDDQHDISKAPELFDSMEEMDQVRMMWDVCGRRNSNFNLFPVERLKEFNAIADVVIDRFEELISENFAICGLCSIDGIPVLLPPFTLP